MLPSASDWKGINQSKRMSLHTVARSTNESFVSECLTEFSPQFSAVWLWLRPCCQQSVFFIHVDEIFSWAFSSGECLTEFSPQFSAVQLWLRPCCQRFVFFMHVDKIFSWADDDFSSGECLMEYSLQFSTVQLRLRLSYVLLRFSWVAPCQVSRLP